MDDLLFCLNEKAGLLKNILAETEKQGGLLARKDLDGLASSIDARQSYMDKIDELEDRIGNRGELSGLAGNEDLACLRGNIEELLKSIMEKDSQNRQNAGELTQTIITGIRETNAEKNLLAYRNAKGTGNLYINRKG